MSKHALNEILQKILLFLIQLRTHKLNFIEFVFLSIVAYFPCVAIWLVNHFPTFRKWHVPTPSEDMTCIDVISVMSGTTSRNEYVLKYHFHEFDVSELLFSTNYDILFLQSGVYKIAHIDVTTEARKQANKITEASKGSKKTC